MGVTGLWQILQPCARPIKIETLNRKRLAVDASIWIYQFLKAVRDKEGNALRNSHVVGFFRRICKLLFFGIKPVFVFDGGAPALKRQTINARKRRREGRRDDAVRTAGKLLAVQMQRRAEEEEQRRKARPPQQEEEAVPDEGLVYVDELQMSQQERQQNRKFRKKDQYHLPELDVSMNEMGGPNDPRVMSLEELEAYARQFETGEDINVYDFSKIDYDSPFFMSLPASDRYNILNAARLRSRLRLGHTKEQLDSMFPDRMEFSRFQIERVTERNELTSRLMNINDGDAAWAAGGTSRIAGEKAREYVLVKNEGVEGGWALGVIGGDEGTKQEKAIDVDKPAPVLQVESEDEEDEGFEDVPIEGLNRLPKRRKLDVESGASLSHSRTGFQSRKRATPRKSKPKRVVQPEDPSSLFVAEEEQADDPTDANDEDNDLFGPEDDDEELRAAIAMSLENDGASLQSSDRVPIDEDEDNDMLEVFQQRAAEEAQPIPKGSARAIANLLNKRANAVAPDSHETTSFGVPVPKSDDQLEDMDDDSVDLQAALAESRRGKRKVSPPPRRQPPSSSTKHAAATSNGDATKTTSNGDATKTAGSFSGPLPFEKLDLGTSILGKKKMQERSEEVAGGFEHPAALEQKKKGDPLPPWFSGDLEKDMKRQKEIETEDRERAKEFNKQFVFGENGQRGALMRHETGEVIDLEAEEEPPRGFSKGEVVDLEAEERLLEDVQSREIIDLDGDDGVANEVGRAFNDNVVKMGDLADAVRVEPPIGAQSMDEKAVTSPKATTGPFMDDESDDDQAPLAESAHQVSSSAVDQADAVLPNKDDEQEDGVIDWSESEDGRDGTPGRKLPIVEPAGGKQVAAQPSRSPSPDFEDVGIPDKPASPFPPPFTVEDEEDIESAPATILVAQESVPDDDDEFDDFSDPEEEELLKALTLEAEEHARFASTLNNKTTAQNIADYEKELKQLRNQQKKDRRDADEVTHIMVTECQQLLRLFGLPYVTAPMEAEAQCAELVSLGLVDGIVTDDSDCFLFGGTRVYKNMFNQAKFVECYLISDLEKEFDLTRDKLIAVAHLLGSDYTEGLPKVGPVTALEILSEFQSLTEFRDWWTGVQMNTIPKEADLSSPFRKKFRKSHATKIFLPPSFPDARVDFAYSNPEVDSDPQPFQWGVPDLDALRSFLMATIGWSQERTDEVLVPVIRDMNKRLDEGTQANITAFFEGGVGTGAAGVNNKGEAFAPRKRVEGSKRMGNALSRMAERAKIVRGNTQPEGDSAPGTEATGQSGGEPNGDGSANKKTRKCKARKPDSTGGTEDDEGASEYEQPRQKGRRKTAAGKQTKGRKRVAFDGDGEE